MGNTLFSKNQQNWVCDKILENYGVDHVQCILVWENRKTDDGIDLLSLKGYSDILFTGLEDKSIQIWNLSNGKCLNIWNNAHKKPLKCLKQWNNWLVSGSYDKTIRIWKVDENTLNIDQTQQQQQGNCIYTLTQHTSYINGFEIWNNSLVSISNDKSICIWKYKQQQQQQHNSNNFNFICSQQIIHCDRIGICIKLWHDCIAIGYNRGIALSDTSLIGIWRTKENGNIIHSVDEFEGHTTTVICLEVWNELLVSGSVDKTIRLWNLNGKCLSIFNENTSSVNCITVLNNMLFSGSRDASINIWNANGKRLGFIKSKIRHIRFVNSIDSLANWKGKLISSSNDTWVSIWKQNEKKNPIS